MKFIKRSVFIPGVSSWPELWFSKVFAETHGGKIQFSSSGIYGKGFVFLVEMPVQRENELYG